MPSNQTRCYIKIDGLDENALSKLDAAKPDENRPAKENSPITVYEKKGGIYEIHSTIYLSDLARELGIPREDIEIY